MRKKLIELETLLKKHAVHTNSAEQTTDADFSPLISEIEHIRQFWLVKEHYSIVTENGHNEAVEAQYALSRIQVTITDYFDENLIQLPENLSPGWKKLIEALEDLQTVLEKCFSQYLDQTIRVPIFLLGRLSKSIRGNYPQLQQLLSVKKVNQTLAHAILQPLEAIAKPMPMERISTGKLIVVRELLDHLLELLNPANVSPDLHMQLLNIITYCNLNTLSATNAAIDLFKSRYDGEDFPLEKLFTINSQLNHFNETHTKPNLSYETTNRHIKVILIEWLEAQQHIQENEISEWNAERGNNTIMRIETSLNVKEIGLLIKLFYECGILLNKNKKRLVRLFARSIQSITKKENVPISEFKLWNATYKTSYLTLINTRRILKNMLSAVDEYLKANYQPGHTKKGRLD
ncbi:hypothetical protein HNQ91_000715 [Filimonas zeae]|nr:hypothetical protein [Filimonas zeae]MDR6337693.1 hypothetical protein [Filimonas zeae]